MAEMHIEHPVEARIYHYIHVVSMITLAFTGFFIHYPFFQGTMSTMRFLHFVAMYTLIFNLIIRMSLAFLSRNRDFKNFGLGMIVWRNLFGTLAYYLFMKKELPKEVQGLYNPPQRLAYVAFVPLIIAQAITGFALYPPLAGYFSWFTVFAGGLLMVRVWHFSIMWVFILITAIHVYLSLFEDFGQFKYMVLSIVPKNAKQ
jgi:Ni/Fe-hydrogenase 1 B-type cytochrome subunit